MSKNVHKTDKKIKHTFCAHNPALKHIKAELKANEIQRRAE